MKLIVTLLLTFSVLSCSTTGNKVEKALYKSSKNAPSLEIPPDLTGLDDSQNKKLPGSSVGTKEAIGRYKESGPLIDSVLPHISGITLQGVGDFYWLEINQDVAKVYQLLKIFWAEEGFILVIDEPLIGIMKTEWLENKAGILFADDSFITNFFSGFYGTDIKDQYRTRVARAGSAAKTHVYLTQYGREFMLLEDAEEGKTKGWQSRDKDPELEVEMLSRMMLFLGVQNTELKEQLAKIGRFPKRARLVKDEDGLSTLVLKESIDRGWNRVVLQLERLHIEFVNKNREQKIIHIKQKIAPKKQEKGFFSSLFASNDDVKEDSVNLYLSFDEAGSGTTIINMKNSYGANDSSKPALALLHYLFTHLK